jgi:beta-lactamase regulating signal transducer with metallopeptidase domain
VIAIITACIHWFNPLVWIFLKDFFADMELACDTKAIKDLKEADKKSYASALLSCSAGKTFYASAFGGAKTRLRIENILSYKRLTLLSSICFAVLFVVIAVTVITNAVGG